MRATRDFSRGWKTAVNCYSATAILRRKNARSGTREQRMRRMHGARETTVFLLHISCIFHYGDFSEPLQGSYEYIKNS